MRRLAIGALLAGAVLAPLSAQDRHGRAGRGFYADPADIVAAEIAFARLARDKGAAAAIRATAAPDAQISTGHIDPHPVRIAALLAEKTGPQVEAWQPAAVWLSCDGTYAVSRSIRHLPAPQPDDAIVTIWQRQPKGGYKWVLRQADGQTQASTGSALPDSDFITAKLADCPPRSRQAGDDLHPPPPARPAPGVPPPDFTSGHADDRTLEWATAFSDGRDFIARARLDGAMRDVVRAHRDPVLIR